MSEVVVVEVNPAEPIRIGASVSGTLRISADRKLDVKRVSLRAKWCTGGVGEVRGGVGEEVSLSSFVVEDGATHQTAFSVEIPDGPITMRGELITVGWQIEAVVHVSWSVNPRASCEIDVLGPSRDAPPQLGYRNAAVQPNRAVEIASSEQPTTLAKHLLRGASLTLGPAVVALLVLTQAPTYILLVTGLGAGWMQFALLRGTLAAWKDRRTFGTLGVTVEPRVILRGSTLKLRASIVAARDLTIDGCDVWLDCAEHASRGTGQHSTARAHSTHVAITQLCTTKALVKGVEERLEGVLFVPEDALPTLTLENNSISWFASIQVQYDGRLVTERVEIEVVP